MRLFACLFVACVLVLATSGTVHAQAPGGGCSSCGSGMMAGPAGRPHLFPRLHSRPHLFPLFPNRPHLFRRGC